MAASGREKPGTALGWSGAHHRARPTAASWISWKGFSGMEGKRLSQAMTSRSGTPACQGEQLPAQQNLSLSKF